MANAAIARVRLTDICNPKQWKTLSGKELQKEGYPVYGANGVIGYYKEYNHADATLLIGCRGSCGCLHVSQPHAWINGNAMCLDSLSSDVDMMYLYHQLKVYDFSKVISGTSQPQITRQGLEKVYLMLPPLPEQRRIAGVLDKIGELKRNAEARLQKLDLLVKARFNEMFGDPIENPFGFERISLKKLTEKIGSGATPKGGKESYRVEGVSLIRSMNVYDGRFKYDELAHLSDEQADELDNVVVKPNDVLINITGASVARSCVVPDNVLPARVNQHVAIVRPNGMALPLYVNNLFVFPSYKRLLLGIGESGGATRQAITKQQLEALAIPLPPLSLQRAFAAFVEKVEALKAVAQKEIAQVDLLYRAKLQEYFG